MRSIRLQLVAWFLGLLVLALGVATLLVYRSAQAVLREKEVATATLIEAQMLQRQSDEKQLLDDRLLEQAFSLASRLKIDFDWGRTANRSLHMLGALTTLPGPMGHLAAAPWLMQHQPSRGFNPFAFEIWRAAVPQLHLAQGDVDLPSEPVRTGQYYQVHTSHYHWGGTIRSRSLGDDWLPDAHGFGGDRKVFWDADTIELRPGHPVRRLRLKTENIRTNFTPWQRPGASRPPVRRSETPPLHLIFQVAADQDRLNARLAALQAERDGKLAAAREETAAALSRLRSHLWVIAGLTLAGTVAGTFWLVWAGLWPLKRLGDAVAQVSPRDFSFKITPAEMPTELQPVTEKLAGALDQLQRAFAREKQAAADISHELRTPLAALLTTCELALKRERTPEKYREMFADCHASARYLHQIVERLLALARLDAGVDRVRPQVVDVAQVAEQCAAVVRPLAEEKGLTLRVHNQAPAEGPIPTRANTDPDKLREVMNNLLHNAIQYNRDAGRIDLTVTRSNGHVRFEVSDTGIGIPEASRERIFERFYRADPSRGQGDGLHAGLGLAIVKEYIEVMGGQIEVDSKEGQGTVFRVDLPAVP
jgi:heavy metal sensor kinase